MHWFKMRKAGYLFRLALCVLVFGCNSDDKAKEWAETYTASSGLTKGTKLKVAKGSYSGDKPITMEEAGSVFDEIIAEETASEYVAQLGPSMDFQPDGAVFDPPAKLYLPFSSKAFDKAREEIPFTHLVVVAKRDGYVGMEVGPVGIIGMEVGPVGKTLTSSQLIGKAFGTIGVIANEGNAENDLLAVINVSHFTTFQVLLMNLKSDKCVPACKDKSCGADGCGGNCGQCTEGTICEDGICELGLTCKESFDCIWNCPGGSVEQCIEPCLSKATPKSAAAGSDLSDCVTKLCAPKVGSELRDCALASFYNECSELFTNCVKCSPECDPGGCGLNNCGIPCINCDPAQKCSGTKCVPGDNCATVLQCFEFCQDDETCKQECIKDASEGAKVALYHLEQCMEEACPDDSAAGCREEANKSACSKEYNQCQSGCVPFCGDAKCGDDGCGGSCGSCDAGSVCSNGSCQSSLTCKEIYNCMMKSDCDLDCQAACQALGTSDAQTEIAALTDCVKGECGPGAKPDCSKPAIEGKCSDAFGICMKCSPSCADQECGTNDCGLSCGDDCASGLACDNSTNKCVTGGACVQLIACKGDCWFNNPDSEQKKDACVELCDAQASEDAKSTLAAYVKCMSAACLEKGTDDCSSDDEDIKIICAKEKALCYTICTPECTGKQCGDDGCGSSCGECQGKEVCNTVTHQCAEEPSCAELMNCCNGIDPVTQSEQYKACMDGCGANATSAAKDQVAALNACVENECPPLDFDEVENYLICKKDAYQKVCNPQYAVCIDCTPVVCSAGECGGNGCNGSCPCNAGKICNEESKMCVTQYIDNDDGTASAPLHNLTWMSCSMPEVGLDDTSLPAKAEWKKLLDAADPTTPNVCPDGGKYKYCNYEGVNANACNGLVTKGNDDGTGELDYSGGHPNDAYKACTKANDQEFAGHKDWRVPTLAELHTMVQLDSVFDAPVLPESGLGFSTPVPKNPVYWSSTSATQGTAYAVNVLDGAESQPPKHHYRLVRCVRDTVCVPSCAPGQQCGDNGCGGSCGDCAASETCLDGACSQASCGTIVLDCFYPDCWASNAPPAFCLMDCYGELNKQMGGPQNPNTQLEYDKVDKLRFCIYATNYQSDLGSEKFADAWPEITTNLCKNEYNICLGCIPNCNGKQCGDNGCGGSCGDCAASEICKNEQCELSPYQDGGDGTATALEDKLMWMICTLPEPNSDLQAWQKDWDQLKDASGKGDPGLCPQGGKFQYCSFGGNACNGWMTNQSNNDLGTLDFGDQESDAYKACERVNNEFFATYSDWRVPTVAELHTMVPLDSVFDAPVISESGVGFEPSPPNNSVYWSADSATKDSAFAVNVTNGTESTPPKQSHYRLIRCVRDDVCVPNCPDTQCDTDDGCGNSCGPCAANETCVNGDCVGSSGGKTCGTVLLDCVYPDCWEPVNGNVEDCMFACMQNAPAEEQAKVKALHNCITGTNLFWTLGSGQFSSHWNTVKTALCKDEYTQCVTTCEPDCIGKVCGDDGCAGNCGTCAGQLICEAGICMGSCMDGYDCGLTCPVGDEACLQTCVGSVYSGDQGLLIALHDCVKIYCDAAADFAACKKGVELNECKTEYYACSKCTPDCTGKACGADGCGGQCDPGCPQGDFCSQGQCQTPTGCQDALQCVLDCNEDAACISDCKSNLSSPQEVTNLDALLGCVAGCSLASDDCFLYNIYDPAKCGDYYDTCVGCSVSDICTGFNCVSNTCGGLCQCTGGLVCQNDGICQSCFSDQDCETPANECLESKCNSIMKCEKQPKSNGSPCSNGSGECSDGQCVSSSSGAGTCDANGLYVTCMTTNPSQIEVPLYEEAGKTKMVLGVDPQFSGSGSITIKFKMPDLISMDDLTTFVTEIDINTQCGNPVFSSEFTETQVVPPEFEVSFDFAEDTIYAFAPFVEFTVPQSPPLAKVDLLSVTCTDTDCTTICVPGQACGDDGCGGVCGICNSGEVCNINNQCEPAFGCSDGLKCTLACDGDPNCVNECMDSVFSTDDQENLSNLVYCLSEQCPISLTQDCFLQAVYDINKCGADHNSCIGCPVTDSCTGNNCGSDNCGGSCHCSGGKICNANGNTCMPCQSSFDCPEPANPCFQAVCNVGACDEQLKGDGLSCPDGVCQSGLCIPGSCSPQGVYFQCPMNDNPDVVQVPLSTDAIGKTVMLLGFAPNYKKNGKLTFDFKIQDLVSLDSTEAAVYELNANGECGSAVSGFVITDSSQLFHLELPFLEDKSYVFSAPIVLDPAVGSDSAIVTKTSLSCDATQ